MVCRLQNDDSTHFTDKSMLFLTPSQMVTKKKMLVYAKSNAYEKKHAFIRQVKW